jgi:hypothetical protein
MDQGQAFSCFLSMFFQETEVNKADVQNGARKVMMIGQQFMAPPEDPGLRRVDGLRAGQGQL